jgi:hypothetical protein
MGCVSSKQFKRAKEYEDPNILAKETTCKNLLPFYVQLKKEGNHPCVFLMFICSYICASCSFCE